MADHEDYLPGEAPAAHKLSHQNGGADEISVAGLSGETARLAAHKLLPSIHHVKFTVAEARAAINNIFGSDGRADADVDLDTHKLLNVVDPVTDQGGDTRKARNDAIATHAAISNAHHAYAEGSWTPVLSRTPTPSAHTYVVQLGYYTRIGNLCIASFWIRISATTVAGVGSNVVTGLPFAAPAGYTQVGPVGYNDVFSVTGAKACTAFQSLLYFHGLGPTAGNIGEAYVNATAYLTGTISYKIA